MPPAHAPGSAAPFVAAWATPLALLALVAGCGSQAGAERERAADAASSRAAVERRYLTARREERSCAELQSAADNAFAQRVHGAALENDELLVGFCPAARRAAVEQTLVMLARREAQAAQSVTRSVRLRLALPLPAGYRLLWLGAYADRTLGLNNLALGPHRIEVELHLWRGGEHDGEMLRVAGAIDVQIDGRLPVLIDALVAGAGGRAVSPTIELRPASTTLPHGARAGAQAGFELVRDKIPFPAAPTPWARVGLPASIELELCFDERGRVARVDPLAWPHPRYLGNYVEALRNFKVQAPVENGLPVRFCTGWRQTVEPSVTTSATSAR